MRIRYAGALWGATLFDDGSLDTVIQIQPVRGEHSIETTRFTLDGKERHENGQLKVSVFRSLVQQAAEDYSCSKHDNCEFTL